MFSPQKTTLKKLFLVTNYKLSQSNKLRLFYSIAIAIAMTMTNTVAIELLKELNAATKIFYTKNVELKKENSLLEIECSTLKNELEHKVRIVEKQVERNSKLQKSIEEKESIQKQKDLEYANSNKFSQNLLDHVKSAKEEFEKEEFEKVEASNTQSRKKSETEMTTVALDTKKILEMLSQE